MEIVFAVWFVELVYHSNNHNFLFGKYNSTTISIYVICTLIK